MTVVKLTYEHRDAIKDLFNKPKFMGVDVDKSYFVDNEYKFSELYYNVFVETYMSDLKNYHAFGYLDKSKKVTTVLGFYQSNEDASWYWNQVRTTGQNRKEIQATLDAVIEYNESQGRFKFFSMIPLEYQRLYRRLAFSKYNNERYDYFEEYYVPEKHRCKFNFHWQILYNRTLVPTDSLVRCTFLKQQYREELFNAGRL
jgi:hypothetical protein